MVAPLLQEYLYEPLPPVTVTSIDPVDPPLHNTLFAELLKLILQMAVVKVVCELNGELLIPEASQIPCTCQ